MPRYARTWVPGAGAHTICRFIDRRFTLVGHADRQRVLECITHGHERWDWTWLSYALMSTHLHYGHIAGEASPDGFYRSAHTRLAQGLHRCTENQTIGPVFADRPRIHAVRRNHLGRMVAYHHRNPEQAGVVTAPSQSMWTSHRFYLRLDPEPPWLDVERALSILGFSDTEAGRRRFDEFVREVDLEDRPWEPCTERPSGQSRRTVRDVDWAHVIRLAREITGTPPHEPMSSKNRAATLARVLVALVATNDFGQTQTVVALRLGLSAGSIGNLIRRARGRQDVQVSLDELRRRLAAG